MVFRCVHLFVLMSMLCSEAMRNLFLYNPFYNSSINSSHKTLQNRSMKYDGQQDITVLSSIALDFSRFLLQ